MSATLVRVGRGRFQSEQIITTIVGENPKQPSWPAHEQVTLATPNYHPDDTARLRALTLRQYDALSDDQKVKAAP